VTADGSRRAFVRLEALDTLWFNTGTLCNIECANCYIESSPLNDRLAYLSLDDVRAYLDEIAAHGLPTGEIGFTGGEPFMNPALVPMLREVLARGFRALVLTNAMQPLQRRGVQDALLALRDDLAPGDRLAFRVSLDHHTADLHDRERGSGSWEVALRGLRWLAGEGFAVHAAGRTCWGDDEASAREGYARLVAAEGLPIDAESHAELVLFPEMDETADVPEITVDCWRILGQSPSDVMCASSRMVVKRKGADRPSVLACTLLPYLEEFELGETLAEADDIVHLNHPHCSKFCVLGGGSCTV
jgi:sulfatase maturation enzyme AslB (radical SAM superfamily)